MSSIRIESHILQKANAWLQPAFDPTTREQVRALLANDPKELIDSFYRDLEFGTGGLRGIMGPGTNRMNRYTVGMATQGLANYLTGQFADRPQISVAIGFDSRNQSEEFANTCAQVFSANGIRVYLFDALRPVPELSFAIRCFKCQAGVVITASHNPKEYNGYKVFWEDGGQVVAPHDENIIAEVQRIGSVSEVKFTGNPELIQPIGPEIDQMYVNSLASLSLAPEVIRRQKHLTIVYTPIHGTGVRVVPQVLRSYGFANINTIPEQDVPDGNFPTVHSPNPEEASALQLALDRAQALDADLLMGTDPDCDRVGLGIRDLTGRYVLINGNQAASLLLYYVLSQWKAKGMLRGREYIVKTIVTTELLARMAQHFGVECLDVLTGFKFIGEKIRQLEGEKTFIGGGEESYGYLVGTFARDKDAVLCCALFAEIAAWAKDQGKTLYQLLVEIYMQFGLYREQLISVTRKGKEGAEQIQALMRGYRERPPRAIGGAEVTAIHDYLTQRTLDPSTGRSTPIDLPKSDVLQFVTRDGTKISVRPSGTEPKIKFYFGVVGPLASPAEYGAALQRLDDKIRAIVQEMGLA